MNKYQTIVALGISRGWLTMPEPYVQTAEDVERIRNRDRMRKIRSGRRDIRRRDLARRMKLKAR